MVLMIRKSSNYLKRLRWRRIRYRLNTKLSLKIVLH